MADSSHLSPRFRAPQHHSGRNSNLFQPPQSPALTSSTDYFSPHRSRKRSRPESVDERHSHVYATPGSAITPAAQSWIQCPTPSDGVYGSSGLVNERYMLRDGFDTPGLMAGTVEYDCGEDMVGRGKMRDEGTVGGGGRSERRLLSGPLARERNGVARTRSSPAVSQQSQQGWASFAFGLVGKMFSFGTGMIRGFSAGGGQGYEMDGTPSQSRPRRPRLSRGSTPVPGAWQEDDFLGDFEQDNYNSPAPSATRAANKRRQTDKDSWVMVGTPDLTDSSPKRKISSSSIPRASNTTLSPRPQASRASSRRSLAPVSRRQSSYATHTGSPAMDATRQRLASPDRHPSRRASFAPTRSSRPSSAHQHEQPQAYVSPEAERFVRKQAKQDRANDKAMKSMSKQLQDLIRQGQEALGTRYDVEGHGDDDGGVGDGRDMEMDEGFVDEEDYKRWR